MEKITVINGLKTAYSESGPNEAPTILLMHGWGCSYATLASIENLLNKNLHVINVDLPGHGKSEEPPAIWGIEEFTHHIEAFVKAICPTTTMLLGHSFGGRIAILYSSQHPEIKKNILVDAAGIKPKRPLKYYLKVYSFKAMKHLYRLILGPEKASLALERRRKRYASADYAAASPIMRGVLSRVVNQDLRYAMPQIKASSLLIWGENDTATPLNDAKIMQRLIPDAGLAALPGCGHYSFLDNPRAFSAILTTFLKQEINTII